jgi:hypothetical protein
MFLRFFRFGVSANFGIADNSLAIRPVTLGRVAEMTQPPTFLLCDPEGVARAHRRCV